MFFAASEQPRHIDFPFATAQSFSRCGRGERYRSVYFTIFMQMDEMLLQRLSEPKAILRNLFFVGMHPRDFWVTQPKSHVHTPVRRGSENQGMSHFGQVTFCNLVTY
jgi:hypothetical protein